MCNTELTRRLPPLASTTVRLRQRVTKGPGSRAAGITMAFKLIESAQARWRAVNATAPRRTGPRWSEVREGQASSNEPTNQEVINKWRDTPIHRY